ncbi:MAG: hypothetical protein ACXAC7_21505 [Candidatus Hodarchaeales archaeon]|jgi:hypothetical protein
MEDKSKSKKSIKRRSMIERIEEIFLFIEKQDMAFPKSRLKEIGINPASAENWLKIIEYIQNQPRIRLISSENNLLIEKIEGKYQAMIRRVITDESISFEQRDLLLRNYLPSLYTREKLELNRYGKNDNLDFPKTKAELVQFVEDYDIFVFDKNNLEELLVAVKKWFDKKKSFRQNKMRYF